MHSSWNCQPGIDIKRGCLLALHKFSGNDTSGTWKGLRAYHQHHVHWIGLSGFTASGGLRFFYLLHVTLRPVVTLMVPAQLSLKFFSASRQDQ
jgi:hypothetical protein